MYSELEVFGWALAACGVSLYLPVLRGWMDKSLNAVLKMKSDNLLLLGFLLGGGTALCWLFIGYFLHKEYTPPPWALMVSIVITTLVVFGLVKQIAWLNEGLKEVDRLIRRASECDNLGAIKLICALGGPIVIAVQMFCPTCS